jgi:hypothetical protein
MDVLRDDTEYLHDHLLVSLLTRKLLIPLFLGSFAALYFYNGIVRSLKNVECAAPKKSTRNFWISFPVSMQAELMMIGKHEINQILEDIYSGPLSH